MMKMTFDKLFHEIYYNPNNPASYGSALKLYKYAKLKNANVTKAKLDSWLSRQLTYMLHKPARRNYSRNKIFVSHEFEQYQADLVDMTMFSSSNQQYKYILTVIDCFSKYAWAIPLKNKTGESVRDALKIAFRDQKPEKLQSDRGREFLNVKVQDYLKASGVHFFTTYNSNFKCAMVERFNRTLKTRMWKVFTRNGNRKYLDILQPLVDSYNNTKHSSTKMRPIDVNEDNEEQVFFNLYGVRSTREYLYKFKINPKIKIGDKVRLKFDVSPLHKGYYPNWTDRVYTISSAIKGTKKPMYKLTDGTRTLPQKFYPEEIQKITEDLYRIEKLVKPEIRNGIRGYIVKWLNYPNTYYSWVPNSEIQQINSL